MMFIFEWIQNYFANAHQAAHWMLKIASVQILMTSVEFVILRDIYSPTGILAWSIIKQARAATFGARTQLFLDALYDRNSMMAIHGLRLVVSVVVLASWNDVWLLTCGLLLIATSLIIHFRTFFGDDGSDQMTFIVVVCSTVYLLCSKLDAAQSGGIAIVFAACQLLLSYLSSGLAKLMSESWRSGKALSQILNHHSYGNALIARHVRLDSVLIVALNYFAISFQVLFVLCLLPFDYLAITLILSGVAFHLGVALVMGINGFVPAFLSAYPALMYIRHLAS